MPRRKNYPGSIRQREGYFQVRLCVEAKYHHFRVEGTDRAVAELFASTKLNELRNGLGATGGPAPTEKGGVSFSSLMARFGATELPQRALNTRKTYTVSMDALRRFFVVEGGDPDIRSVGRGQVQAFLHWRRHHKPDGTERKKPLSGRTLEKDRAMAHNLFAFAEGLELLDVNPVSKVKPPRYDKRQYPILSNEQYEGLLTACEHNPFL